MDDEYERKVAKLARALWSKNGWIGEIEDYRQTSAKLETRAALNTSSTQVLLRKLGNKLTTLAQHLEQHRGEKV